MEKINIRKSERIRINRKKVLFILFIILMLVMYNFISNRLIKLFEEFCYMKAKIITIQTVNKAINAQMSEIDNNDIVTYEKNNDGEVNLVKYNSVVINSLLSKFALNIQNDLSSLEKDKITIPLGTIIGSKVFADYGPRFSFSICPSRECRLRF